MNPHFIFSLFYFDHEFMMCLQFLTSGVARVTLLYIKKIPQNTYCLTTIYLFYIREGILNKHLMANTPVLLIQMNSNEVCMSAWFLVCSSKKTKKPTHFLSEMLISSEQLHHQIADQVNLMVFASATLAK